MDKGSRSEGFQKAKELVGDEQHSGEGFVDVLVVDDESNVAQTTVDILRSEGLTASTAATVEEALAVIGSCKVRTVIVDHHIAGEDGVSILDKGGELPPVIVMSGMDRDALAELEATHGDRLFACLAKPVPPRNLIEVVKVAISRR